MKLPPLPPPDWGNHSWTSLQEDGLEGLRSVEGESWNRYVEKYSVGTEKGASKLPAAIYFCTECHILVPEGGPRPEDEDCGPLQVALVMES
jgi:hypothetical protein